MDTLRKIQHFSGFLKLSGKKQTLLYRNDFDEEGLSEFWGRAVS